MEELELYRSLLENRENDSKRLWTLFSLLNVTNALLINHAITKFNPILGILGIVLCVVWFLIQIRMISWIKWWEHKLKKLERSVFKQDLSNFKLFRKRKNPLEKKCKLWRWTSTRFLSQIIPLAFFIFWLLYISYPTIFIDFLDNESSQKTDTIMLFY